MAVDKDKLRQKLQFMRENIAHLRYFQEMTFEEFSREMKETYQSIVRFRNRVVHLYDNVDKQEIFMQRVIEHYF